MKLRNKKTKEIGYLHIDSDNQVQVARNTGYNYNYYDTLTELVEEWEDVPEEPKVGYIIDPMEEDCVSADNSGYKESDVERAKELGIWFGTEEKAEKTVEWLKARKALFDDAKGFKPDWSVLEKGFIVYYGRVAGKLIVGGVGSYIESPGPYFTTKEDAEASIKAHEKEWKIYLLGVEE